MKRIDKIERKFPKKVCGIIIHFDVMRLLAEESETVRNKMITCMFNYILYNETPSETKIKPKSKDYYLWTHIKKDLDNTIKRCMRGNDDKTTETKTIVDEQYNPTVRPQTRQRMEVIAEKNYSSREDADDDFVDSICSRWKCEDYT